MKTTEIFIEQVLIGSLLSVIVILFATQGQMLDLFGLKGLNDPATVQVPLWFKNLKTLHSIGLGAAFVGFAYWIGILYDRIADTLMQDIERHGRLAVALNSHEALKKAPHNSGDVFPEDKLRLVVQANAALTHLADYLRIRMRLTRALSSLLPALTLIWILVKLHNATAWEIGAWGAGIAYGGAFLLKYWGITYRPPRTDDIQKLNVYRRRHRKQDKCTKEFTLKMSCQDALDSTFLVAIAYGVFCYVLLHWFSQLDKLWLLPLAGAGFTWLAAWVWWRISQTFYAYLKTVEKYGDLTPKVTYV